MSIKRKQKEMINIWEIESTFVSKKYSNILEHVVGRFYSFNHELNFCLYFSIIK